MALYEEVQRPRANQNIKQIAEQMGLSRGTVRIYYYAEAFPERGKHKRNPNKLDPFLPYLERLYREGCKNAMQLWREIRALGYPRSHRRIYQWMNQRRKQSGGHESSPPVDNAPVQKAELGTRLPSVKKLAWLLVREVGSLSEKELMTLWQICLDPTIEKVYTLSQAFTMMVRQRIASMLDPWLIACQDSGVTNLQTFADGVKRDYNAIRGALETSWSNGQTEGQVNRLKML